VPAKTPPEIVKRLYDEGRKAIELPATKTALARLGYETRSMTPQEFQAFFLKDFDATVALAKQIGIKPND
jgi:tripartite-type tricarboxylate transporter receptor subunit TctC